MHYACTLPPLGIDSILLVTQSAGPSMVETFLEHYNGVSVIPTSVTVSNLDLFTCDACLDACGAVCFGEYFHATFPPFIAR